jgi:hypothetical protein
MMTSSVTGEMTSSLPVLDGFSHFPPMKKAFGALIDSSVSACNTALIGTSSCVAVPSAIAPRRTRIYKQN